MRAFAKIFTCGEHQVLVTKEEEDEPENSSAPFAIEVRSDFDGLDIRVRLNFSEEEKRDADFESTDQERAEQLFAPMLSTASLVSAT